MTSRPQTVDSTETITVTNVVSAPAINKLGSLFNSLNKTVTGALNTFITQQQTQTQPSAGVWQPVNPQQQQFGQQFVVPTATQVQRFPTSAAPLPQSAALPLFTAAAAGTPAVVAPQRPPGAPRFPSDASSAFVRVTPSTVVGGGTVHRPPQPPPGAVHHQPAGAPPSPALPVRNHVQHPPPPSQSQSQFTQSPPQLSDAANIYRELPRNHVDSRSHLAPAPGRGQCL